MASDFLHQSEARLYFETRFETGSETGIEAGGTGTPFVMIHAGVADHRQWNHEFEYFRTDYRVLRYDMRGFGWSEPAGGAYRPIDDLEALMNHVGINSPAVMMGCSMGGTLAMDFTITHPDRVAALIMVGSGPSGLRLDVPFPEKFKEVEKAEQDGDLDLVCELETQIWFDGDRDREVVDPDMRKLAYDMNRKDLDHQELRLGKRLPDLEPPAADRLDEITCPVLVIVGDHDLAYMQGAAEHMEDNLANVTIVHMKDAAHLPNMDHPDLFQQHVSRFLRDSLLIK
jgi:pimeloyl-ACP methyl ester carboxylesterase